MIVFDPGPALVRPGEAELAGRRIAAVASPYSPEVGGAPWRFELRERRFREVPAEGRVAVGPPDEEAWSAAMARCPGGPILIGPSSRVEAIRGAFRAAARGARRAGRGAYLLDPDPAGLPEGGEASDFVALFTVPALLDAPLSTRVGSAAARGIPSGVLLALVPGWTAEPAAIDAVFEEALAGGAGFVSAIEPARDGESRRAIVAAREAAEPGASETYFERIHHGAWKEAIVAGAGHLSTLCLAKGLDSVPARPVGRSEPRANAAAAARLEESAADLPHDEHRFAVLHAAARWIDDYGRDLAPICREGNFRKIFPFPAEVVDVAEAALRVAAP